MQTDRIVVVTGASGGTGRLVAARFLANGDTVVATDTSNDALGKLDANPKLATIAADITKEVECQAVADIAREKGGRVDVLVNVAGWYPIQPFEGVEAQVPYVAARSGIFGLSRSLARAMVARA